MAGFGPMAVARERMHEMEEMREQRMERMEHPRMVPFREYGNFPRERFREPHFEPECRFHGGCRRGPGLLGAAALLLGGAVIGGAIANRNHEAREEGRQEGRQEQQPQQAPREYYEK